MWYRCYRRLIHYFRANNRHGTHSPFVYAFVEQVLNARAPVTIPEIESLWEAGRTEKQMLQQLMVTYGTAHRICRLDTVSGESPQIYVLLPGMPFRLPDTQDIIIVPGIFDNRTAFRHWQQLCLQEQIPMSIETPVMGLLFFRKEFKRKQHFRLKRG